MKIYYVARHDQTNSNQDEQAIAYALQQLGHEVVTVEERWGAAESRSGRDGVLLFHHWADLDTANRWNIPRFFWYFDRVTLPDPTLADRSAYRRKWIKRATEICTAGFCTDGDWVEQDRSGKLHWLPQGADERVLGRGTPTGDPIPLLFYGARGHGTQREDHLRLLANRYGDLIRIIEGNRRIYRRQLADAIASADICIAPESPVTDRYWSNRVYVTLGFGGFLLHPYAERLARQYEDRNEIFYYSTRQELYELIHWLLPLGDMRTMRTEVQTAALERTRREHTYRHRCEQLVKWIKDRL